MSIVISYAKHFKTQATELSTLMTNFKISPTFELNFLVFLQIQSCNSGRECKSPATLRGLVLLRWKTPIDELVPEYSRQRSMNIDEEDLDTDEIEEGHDWKINEDDT